MQGPIGFVGLGIMGRPMAKNLLKAGHALVVHNRSQAAVHELAGLGAKTAESPAAVARAPGAETSGGRREVRASLPPALSVCGTALGARAAVMVVFGARTPLDRVRTKRRRARGRLG